MIVILKIILSLFVVLGIFIAKTLYKDFRLTEKTSDYEDSTVIDKIKIKFMLYFSLIAICTFCSLLVYYIIIPMQITTWW